MSQPKRHSQVLHKRTYWGEDTASVLVDWLNHRVRPKGDPVEALVRLQGHHSLVLDGDPRQKSVELVNRTTRSWGLSLVPVAGLTPDGWTAEWRHRPTSKAHPLQLLAFVKALHLASDGLLQRVRQCGRTECGRYYYERFPQQEFCSTKCRELQKRSTPEWKKSRAQYMQRHRHGLQERERRGVSAVTRKKKGAKKS